MNEGKKTERRKTGIEEREKKVDKVSTTWYAWLVTILDESKISLPNVCENEKRKRTPRKSEKGFPNGNNNNKKRETMKNKREREMWKREGRMREKS